MTKDSLQAAFWLRAPSVRRVLVCLLIGMGAAGVLAAAASLTAAPARTKPSNLELKIPAGAAAAVARGETPLSIPAKLQFQSRAKLLIRNEDSVPHHLAWLFIAPGDEYEAPVSALFQSSGRFVCSFHFGGSIATESLGPASSGLAPVWTTLLIGLPLAAAIYGVSTLMSKLDSEPLADGI